MAWTAPMTAVATNALSAANFNTHVRDNLVETEASKAATKGAYFVSTAANAIAERSFLSQQVLLSQTTSSTSYGDLLTSGPAVYCETGTQALVWIRAEMQNSGATNLTAASIDVSGASTVAASDQWAIQVDGVTAANSNGYMSMHMFTGLTAGFNTFKMVYRVAAGTGTFLNREILVMPL